VKGLAPIRDHHFDASRHVTSSLANAHTKILDYRDIEPESSFPVLGRECGRTRRVLTLGFLVLGGDYPIVIDAGCRSNQITETIGMRGQQLHENMIENRLSKHGVQMGDVRFVLHTRLHIDHAGKDDLFPMNTAVVINRKEVEYSVSGLTRSQYPAPDIKYLDLETSLSIELMPASMAKQQAPIPEAR
jgi:glyoxylase-like metal-dependent hydrolase (beta-lactamase superfamily II)